MQKKVKEKLCSNCKKTFFVKSCHFERRKYCSRTCQYSSIDFRKRMSEQNHERGAKSEETKRRISETLKRKGIMPPRRWGSIPWNKGKRHLQVTGNKNPFWKGENASYHTKHAWVNKWLGKAKECSLCKGVENNKMYHWANISGEYKRDLCDYSALCVPCHKKYDMAKTKVGKKRRRLLDFRIV